MIWTYHGIFFALGAIVSALSLGFWYRRFRVLSRWSPVEQLVFIFLVGLVGAKLAYGLFTLSTNWLDYLAFWQVGLVSWGGLAAGAVASFLLYRRWGQLRLRLNLLILAVIPGWMVGRVGNLLQHDAYGVVDYRFSWFYNRVPVALFEIIGLLLIWLTALILTRRDVDGKYLIGTVVTLYAGIRLVIDGWRELPAVAMGLNASQLVALGVMFCAIVTLWMKQPTRAT
ncbi:MAG: prolipoprotein diacylglyceryl transferase [bacterium]|nr:prolipoprotein diacylglyceryl transferase [bacterium]